MAIDPTQLRLGSGLTATRAGASASAGAAGVDFRDLIDPRDFNTGRAPRSRDSQALHAARDVVAASLIEPILAEAHKDPFQVEMFHGGQAEKVFQQRMDQVMSSRLVQQTHMPVVDAIYRKLTQTGGARGGAAATATATAKGVNLSA